MIGMAVLLSATWLSFLQLWLTCALLTGTIHIGISLAIDRRFTPGLWEKWALALFMACGPLGVCLEVLLVLKVWQDIQLQRRCGTDRGRPGIAPPSQ